MNEEPRFTFGTSLANSVSSSEERSWCGFWCGQVSSEGWRGFFPRRKGREHCRKKEEHVPRHMGRSRGALCVI